MLMNFWLSDYKALIRLPQTLQQVSSWWFAHYIYGVCKISCQCYSSQLVYLYIHIIFYIKTYNLNLSNSLAECLWRIVLLIYCTQTRDWHGITCRSITVLPQEEEFTKLSTATYELSKNIFNWPADHSQILKPKRPSSKVMSVNIAFKPPSTILTAFSFYSV